MKYKLEDLCFYAKGKIEVEALTDKNYISTENMLPNKIASSIQYLHIDRGRSYPQSSRISGLE